MHYIRITKKFKFEMAHALVGHDGPCRHIHGHSYELSITLKGQPVNDSLSPRNGMVMDFGELNRIVKSTLIDRFDHALVLNDTVRDEIPNSSHELFARTIWVKFQPTTENLLLYFVEILQPLLPSDIELYCIKLSETATSFAEWYAPDQSAY